MYFDLLLNTHVHHDIECVNVDFGFAVATTEQIHVGESRCGDFSERSKLRLCVNCIKPSMMILFFMIKSS